jgi:hypothetical protein
MEDGRRISLFNRDTYESIANKLNELSLDAVWPEQATEGGDAPDFRSVIYDRALQLKTCDMAIVVPGWMECKKARKMKQTVDQNNVPVHWLMNGYNMLKDRAYELVTRKAS